MGFNRSAQVGEAHFSGASKVHEKSASGVGHLVDIVRDMLQREAQDAINAASITAFTDNSAGLVGNDFTVDTGDDTIILATPTALVNGDGPFRVAVRDAGVIATGLSVSVDYWVQVFVATTEYTLHLTKAAALDPNSTPVNITAAATVPYQLSALVEAAVPVAADKTGVNTSFTAASWDASVDDVMDALATVAEQANLALAEINGGSVNEGPGTGNSGTIAVLDVDLAVNASDTTGTTFQSAFNAVLEMQESHRSVVALVNQLRAAVGLNMVAEGGLGAARKFNQDITTASAGGNVHRLAGPSGANPGLDVRTAAAAITDGVTTTATTITSAGDEGEFEAVLVAFADNVSYLAVALDEVTDIAAGGGPSHFNGPQR